MNQKARARKKARSRSRKFTNMTDNSKRLLREALGLSEEPPPVMVRAFKEHDRGFCMTCFGTRSAGETFCEECTEAWATFCLEGLRKMSPRPHDATIMGRLFEEFVEGRCPAKVNCPECGNEFLLDEDEYLCGECRPD